VVSQHADWYQRQVLYSSGHRAPPEQKCAYMWGTLDKHMFTVYDTGNFLEHNY